MLTASFIVYSSLARFNVVTSLWRRFSRHPTFRLIYRVLCYVSRTLQLSPAPCSTNIVVFCIVSIFNSFHYLWHAPLSLTVYTFLRYRKFRKLMSSPPCEIFSALCCWGMRVAFRGRSTSIIISNRQHLRIVYTVRYYILLHSWKSVGKTQPSTVLIMKLVELTFPSKRENELLTQHKAT